MLPLSSELLISELESTRAVLDKWITRVKEGIPMVDLPADEESFARFVRELCGELAICSRKCDSLSEILSESFSE